jgi:hypothetical protein
MRFWNSELMLGSPTFPKQHFFQDFPTHRAFTLPHNKWPNKIVQKFAWKFSFRKRNETTTREDVFIKKILTQLIDSYWKNQVRDVDDGFIVQQ